MRAASDNSNATPPRAGLAQIAGYLIGPAFLAFAVYLFMSSRHVDLPSAPTPVVTPAQITIAPPRTALGDPPIVTIGGYAQRCNACHKLFKTRDHPDRPRVQHLNITLRHGLNNRCLNCHDRENRERLTLRNGDTVIFPEVAMLCAQCHGPVYRDWTRGAHGKTLGAWSPEVGQQRKLICTECHDPHSPAYPPYVPLPGPHTLRLGSHSAHDVHEEIRRSRNALLHWSSERAASTAPATGDKTNPAHKPKERR